MLLVLYGQCLYFLEKEGIGIVADILLTIAIPTYNRCELLSRCLKYLLDQRDSFMGSVEILVFDNASTDNTEQVVHNYASLGLEVKYYKNSENKGSDFNITQCYQKAVGKFVVAFGDDDVLYPNAIAIILNLLKDHSDLGVLYLNWDIFNTSNHDTTILHSEAYIYEDYEDFCAKVNHNLTFISSNVVNSNYIKGANLDNFLGTSIVQLTLMLKATAQAPYNISIKRPLVGVEPDNSGGYSVCKVFGENINKIFVDFNTTQKKDRIIKRIKEKLLVEVFPNWIYRIKTKGHFLDGNDIHKDLAPVYAKNIQYWLFIYPLILCNKFSIRMFWPLYQLYLKTGRRIFRIFTDKVTSQKTIKIQFDE